MIPPLRPARLRGIERWLRDGFEPLTDSEVSIRAAAIDEAMIEVFDRRVDALLSALMRRGDWGHESATADYRTGELMIWNEIFEAHLPHRGG